jgi:peptidoglycan lytic transglycosylase
VPGAGSRGLDAQFRLAFVQFRQGKYTDAANGWRALASRVTQADARAQALFWQGKALAAAGDAQGARAAWSSASGADPAGFYSLRAADLLASASTPRAQVDRTAPIVERHADDDLAAEIGAWASSRGGSSPSAAQARLAADPAFARAGQLLALGLRREATWELDALAGRLGNDVAALGQLGAWEQSRGLYNTALVLGFSLAGTANVNLLTGAPAVRKLVYPLVHPVALAEAARQQHVDPLLFSGLMRQESNFDQNVESAAQARGLSQLIASTAYDAARALGLYQFQTTDLFQPQTSITLGAYTFEQRLARYDQQIFPALAAYNATQYAVDGWLLAANTTDIDTFAEAIPFTETYPYVQQIYENYRQYLELYGS